MKSIRLVPLTIAAAVVACGGSASAPNTEDFRANAPTFEKVAISQNDSDEVEPTALVVNAGPSGDLTQSGGPECHPHLFANTDEVIGRVNAHFFKLVRHVEDVIKNDPATSTGDTKVWENVKDGIDRKLTVTATINADGSISYVFELDLAVAVATTSTATETFTKVMFGTLTHTGPAASDVTDAGAAVAVENKGDITFDFDALHSVITSEPARGQIEDQFDDLHDPVKGIKRVATMTLTNFVPDDPQAVVHGPRNGQYTWEREPGTGGFFQYQDSFILNCPANPQRAVADVNAVARWYRLGDGSVHGRSDAQATGGQIPTGDKWEGVTCAQGPSTITAPAEGEWMMKEEDASGNTLFSSEVTVGLTPCDPLFGPVPDLNDATNDYNFTSAVTFPNEW